MHDILNAFVLLSNFVIVPAAAYGSQLALGALGVTLVYGILRFSNFAHGDTMALYNSPRPRERQKPSKPSSVCKKTHN